MQSLLYGGLFGPLAMIGCKLRQARKGATVATDSCAGMWLGRLPPTFLLFYVFLYTTQLVLLSFACNDLII